MKVLMSADAVGGVWTYALELARALSRRGVETVLAAMGPEPSPAQRHEALAIPGLRLELSTYRLEWMDDPWTDVERAGEWLLKLEAAHAPNLIHLNGYAHAVLPWRAPVVVVAHSCVTGWWEAVHGARPPASFARYEQALRRGLRAADAVVAPTHAMLASLERLHGLHLGGGRVIPNGRSADGFAPASKEPLVLAVGRAWDASKDFATLDAAAAGAPWPVQVAGDPRNPDTGAVASLRHAKLLGRIEEKDLRDRLARASVFVHPARYEPFGLAPLEAALSGCALVLADLPSLREVWGDAAWYFAPGDSGGLRALLQRAADDPSALRQAASQARARARGLNPDAMAGAYLDLYLHLSPSKLATPEGTP